MNLALIILKTGQTLIAQTDQLDYEPKVHLLNPMLVTGKTNLSLQKWPEYTDDKHVLLQSDTLLTVCEPNDKLTQSYIKKVGITKESLTTPDKRVTLTEDTNDTEDEYEPRYIEEPIY